MGRDTKNEHIGKIEDWQDCMRIRMRHGACACNPDARIGLFFVISKPPSIYFGIATPHDIAIATRKNKWQHNTRRAVPLACAAHHVAN